MRLKEKKRERWKEGIDEKGSLKWYGRICEAKKDGR